MAERILVINREKCTGCGKCETVCSVYHTGTSNPARSRIKVLRWDHVGFYLPVSCQNCDHASCAEVCPSGACRRQGAAGVTAIDPKVCIGCKSCVLACPFGVPVFDRTEGVSVKCDYCGGDPRCVAACEAGALAFISPADAGMARLADLSRRLASSYVTPVP